MQQRGRAQRPFDRRVGTPTRHGSPGQAIVEFALVIPLFLTVLVGVIEFGFLLNAVNTVNYATRDAALIAAEAGNNTTADCAIVKQVFADMGAPTTWDQVTEIRIYLADVNGNGANGSTVDVYSAGGSTTCVTGQDSQGHDITTDYPVLAGSTTYAPAQRCNILAGCPSLNRSGIDTIGVEVSYQYAWHTPLGNLIGGLGNAPLLSKANAERMEPVL